jgi:hypothetical protein
MSAFEREISCIVLFHGIREEFESLYTVASGTILNDPVFHELAIVIIGVAIGAVCVSQRGGEAGLMAFLAGNGDMPAGKREICFRMVEAGYPFHRVKRLVGVALGTVGAEFVLVRIGMAVRAVLETDPCKFLEFQVVPGGYRMAFDAGDRLMHPGEGIFCPVVAELHGRFEGVVGVAFCAGCRDGLLVIIGVTGNTVLAQPEVGRLFAFYLRLGDAVFPVAIGAGFFGMHPGECKPCKVMIEFILIEPDDLETDSVVVVVTAHAALPADPC